MSWLAAPCHTAELLPVPGQCRQTLPSSLTALQGTVNHLTLVRAAFSLGFANIPTSMLFWFPFCHSALAELQPGHFSSSVCGSQVLLHQPFHKTMSSYLHFFSSSSANLSGILIAPVSIHQHTPVPAANPTHFLPISSETLLF